MVLVDLGGKPQYLTDKYPERFDAAQLRTLQRRVKVWRALNGQPKVVFFAQEHVPGATAQSDFTNLNELHVTINRQPFPHLFYHFCLPYSNWETGSVCFSESFEALSDGLQNALWELGAVPHQHRTDNLTAAVIRVGNRDEFTAAYQGLLNHYQMAATHSNPRSPNENGDVEQAHYRFKQAVTQALILRGHREFATRAAYERFLQSVLERRNLRRTPQLQAELSVMQGLPSGKMLDFTELRCRVSRHSTIWAKGNLYSVPSQLINEWISVRLFAERLELWFGDRLIEKLERTRGRQTATINYRHVIHSLIKKPGAFAGYRHRQQMFPRLIFRVAYDRLTETMGERADKEYLRILEMAAVINETKVAEVLQRLVETGALVTADAVFKRCHWFGSNGNGWQPTTIAPVRVNLSVYDELLGGVAVGGEVGQ